jgi:hypothetical protein
MTTPAEDLNNPTNVVAITRSVATVMRELVGKAIKDVTDRLIALEKRVNDIPAGPKGDAGETGPKGDPGKDAAPVDTIVAAILPHLPIAANGKDGVNGKDGASFIAGEGPPLALGSPGDVYMDVSTGDVYQCS